MWIIAFIGAASAFMEATLAQVYKVHDKEGGFRGGQHTILLRVSTRNG